MANYTPTFTKPYPNGWVDKPSKTTPATAAIMNSYDTAIAALEAYLRDNAIDTVSVSVEQFPSDGRQWLGTITVGSNQYKIYMPSLKYENSVSNGTKIGVITLGEQSFDVYVPTSSTGGSTVSVLPKTLTGTNIAEITVDGTTYQLYAPTAGSGSGSTVTAEATLTEGTQIGKITIDGTETILYAPTASTITVDSELSATSENPVQNKVVKSEFDHVNSNLSDLKYGESSGSANIFNFEKWKNTLTDNSVIRATYSILENGIKIAATSQDGYVVNRACKILTEANKKYTVSWDRDIMYSGLVYVFDGKDNTIITFADNASTNKFTFTSKSESVYIRFGASNANTSITYTNIQIEEGTQATDYKPYIPSVKMLASDLSDVKDGTTPVAKAVADEDGNNIKNTYATKTEASGAIVEDVPVTLNTDLFDSSNSNISCICIGKLCVLSFTLHAPSQISSTMDKLVLVTIVGKKYMPKSFANKGIQRFQGFAVGNYDESGKQSQSLNNMVRIITRADSNYTEIITTDKDRINWLGYVQGQIIWVTD